MLLTHTRQQKLTQLRRGTKKNFFGVSYYACYILQIKKKFFKYSTEREKEKNPLCVYWHSNSVSFSS